MATIQEALNAAVQRLQAGRYAEVQAICGQILAVDGANADALHLSGLAARQQGKHDEAVRLLIQAIRSAPQFVVAWLNLGNTFRAAGRREQAARCYRNAVAIAPGLAAAWHMLGSILTLEGGSGARDEAIRSLRHATALEPGAAEALHDLGLALRYAERLDEGIGFLRRATEVRPDHTMAWMNLGTTLLENGEHAQALAGHRRAVACAPDSAEVHYNHGNALHASGEPGEALTAFRRAAWLGLAQARTRIGLVLQDLGRLDEAEAEFRRDLAEGGDAPATLERLARVFIETGRAEQGRHFFAELIRTTPVGRTFRGECLTALADLDLHEGQAQRAAALVSPVQGDNGRFFTVKTIAALRLSLEKLGATLERPANPAPGRPAVTSSTLGTLGRFAHNVLEYVLVRLYAEKHGFTLETPEWVGGYVFGIDDPLPSRSYRPVYYPRKPLNRWLAGEAGLPPTGPAPMGDVDFRSPLFLFRHREEYRERVQSWLRPRPVWTPFLEPAMERLRARGDTVVAIHIRRGDFVSFNYPITETAWYVRWLREIWPTLKRPVLYIASDDLAGVRADFAEFAPLTRPDVAEDWAGLEFLQDFHALMHADVVGISAASGFSLLAAQLNRRARLFVEPDVAGRRIRPFAPWTS